MCRTNTKAKSNPEESLSQNWDSELHEVLGKERKTESRKHRASKREENRTPGKNVEIASNTLFAGYTTMFSNHMGTCAR